MDKGVSTLIALFLVVALCALTGCFFKADDDDVFNPSGTRIVQKDPSTEPGGSAQGRLEGILHAHNAIRANVAADPSLKALIWSDELAEVAQKWAVHLQEQGCDMRHSSVVTKKF